MAHTVTWGWRAHLLLFGHRALPVADAAERFARVVTHGDHFHYCASEPGISGIRFEAPEAGHVRGCQVRGDQVRGDKRSTTLFADGDGSIQTFVSEHLTDGQPRTETMATDSPHHGVALQLMDGTLLTTQGTEQARDTVQVTDGDGLAAET